MKPESNPNPDEPEKPDYPIYPPGKPPAKKPKPPSNKAKPRSEHIKWPRPQRQATDWKELGMGLATMAGVYALVLLANFALLGIGISMWGIEKLLLVLVGICVIQIPLGILAYVNYNSSSENASYVNSGISLAIATTLLACGSIFMLWGMCGSILGGLVGYKNF